MPERTFRNDAKWLELDEKVRIPWTLAKADAIDERPGGANRRKSRRSKEEDEQNRQSKTR